MVAGEPTLADNDEPFRIGPFSTICLIIIIGISGYVLLSLLVALVFSMISFDNESKKSVQIDHQVNEDFEDIQPSPKQIEL
jgi:hypothetical protein